MSAAAPAAAAPAASAAATPAPAAAAATPAAASEVPAIPPGHVQLYVKNLSFSSTDASLAAFVEQRLGQKAHSVHIVTRRTGGRSRGFGFITLLASLQNAAIEKLNNVELEGRVLAVVEAKPRDPNAPAPQRTQRPPRAANANAAAATGAPQQQRAPRKPRNADNADASSSSSSSSSTATARPPRPERKTFPDATQLYVNNLAFSASADEVSALFEAKTGMKPLDVDIVRFQYGRFAGNSRGFGFVFVPNAVVDKALAMDKSKLNDRELGIQLAKAPADKPSGGAAATGDAAQGTDADGARRRPRRRRGPRRTDGAAPAPADGAAPAAGATGDEAPNNRRRQGGAPAGEDGADGATRGRRRRFRGRGRGRGGAAAGGEAAPAPATTA